MHPGEIARLIERDPRLILPIGTCEQHGAQLPLGSDTIIVERLGADLSAEFDVLLAPTVNLHRSPGQTKACDAIVNGDVLRARTLW